MGGVYYPSLAVNFRIRFDEAFNIEVSDPQSVADLAQSFGDGTLPIAPGTTVRQPLIMSGTHDDFSQVLGIVPRDCVTEINGYRQAGKFQLTLEWRDFPFDPRVIRALGVEIYLDSVANKDFAKGVTSATAIGRRQSVIVPSDENLIMIGTGDEISATWSEKSMLVHIEGRDLRGILIDLPIVPQLLTKLDLTQPIHLVIGQILAMAPQALGINVEVFDDDWPGGTVPNLAVAGDLTRVRQGATGDTANVTPQGEVNSLKFWDLITQYCFLVGGVPYFAGRTLRIRPARSLYSIRRQDANFDPANGATPFLNGAPRQVVTGVGSERRTESFSFRRMIFGKNLGKFQLDRKLGGVKVPTVECYSIDTSSKQRGQNKLISAQWPALAPGVNVSKLSKSKVTTVAPSGQVTQQDVVRIPVAGIKSKDRLQAIAKQLYEEIGRGEMGGSASTKDLASFGGDNADPDLLRLRTGDPIEFRVVATGISSVPPVVSELTSENALSFQEAVDAIAARLGDRTLARVLVGTARGSIAELQRTFRVNNIKYTWNNNEGVGIDFDFNNYVEARYDVGGD